MRPVFTAPRRIALASLSALLALAIAGPVAAQKPAAPTSSVSIVSIDEDSCLITVRYDWANFTGRHLLVEVLLYERENGADRVFLGGSTFDVLGSAGSTTKVLGGFTPYGDARPIYATGALWTSNNNTRRVEGSLATSDATTSACQG